VKGNRNKGRKKLNPEIPSSIFLTARKMVVSGGYVE
jgi:hypothetical protein